MGLLDQVMGGVRPGQAKPGLGSTLAAGVALALLVKGVRHYQSTRAQRPEERTFDPQRSVAGGEQSASPDQKDAPADGLGGLLGGLGGGLGGLLSQFGGAGALGALVSHLQQKGLGQEVGSWVARGENRPIAPQQLAEALGPDTVQDLERHTGMPRDALLQELSQELPQALDAATPEGRLPDDQELNDIARQPAPPTGH